MNITPLTKIGEMLDHYPHLEQVLVSLAPAFEKLKNPILRKTVAKVATIQQAAAIANIKVDDMVNRLREAAGLLPGETGAEETRYIVNEPPPWFYSGLVAKRLDATGLINSGGNPMANVQAALKQLARSEILELVTPFVPAPLLEMLNNQGYDFFVLQSGSQIISYIRERAGQQPDGTQ